MLRASHKALPLVPPPLVGKDQDAGLAKNPRPDRIAASLAQAA